MEGYSVKITMCSKELTHKERVQIKDMSNAVGMDELTANGPVTLDVAFYAVLDVHNELSESVDYTVCVLVDKAGTKYRTTSLEYIMADMDGCDEEWNLEVYRQPSKNYKGKEFLTCSVV